MVSSRCGRTSGPSPKLQDKSKLPIRRGDFSSISSFSEVEKLDNAPFGKSGGRKKFFRLVLMHPSVLPSTRQVGMIRVKRQLRRLRKRHLAAVRERYLSV